MRIGVTFGVWDMLHYGHIRLFERAKLHVDTLIVGICSDSLNMLLKGTNPIIHEWHRLYLVNSLKSVDDCFLYSSTDYIEWMKHKKANVFVAGEQFGQQGVKNHQLLLDYCDTNSIEVIRLSRTPNISTTQLKKEVIAKHG